MSEQQGQAGATAQRRSMPTGYLSWQEYWTKEHNQPWRTEPEIDEERQRYLRERRLIPPDIEKGIYPFRDETGGIKLTRADIEWLLATHGDGRGPIEVDDDVPGVRRGLDVRGADIRGVNLRRLPLVRLYGGLVAEERPFVSRDKWEIAGVHLEGASLYAADLRHACLTCAYLQGADLSRTRLDQAFLRGAHLDRCQLIEASFDKTGLREVTFDGAFFDQVDLGTANLAVVNWNAVHSAGDETTARRRRDANGVVKSKAVRKAEFEAAARAYRVLGSTLRNQGINEHADRFAYRAQVLQRRLFRMQRHYLQYLGSILLWLVAGYGYRPLRSFITYVIVILVFAAAFFTIGTGVIGIGGHEAINSPISAIVFSVTSFHGRGFFPGGGLALDDSITILAAAEAIMGLFIEITFIATFTQRFFAR